VEVVYSTIGVIDSRHGVNSGLEPLSGGGLLELVSHDELPKDGSAEYRFKLKSCHVGSIIYIYIFLLPHTPPWPKFYPIRVRPGRNRDNDLN
jgi:hypothetical protein